jgi:hypothetical protein
LPGGGEVRPHAVSFGYMVNDLCLVGIERWRALVGSHANQRRD